MTAGNSPNAKANRGSGFLYYVTIAIVGFGQSALWGNLHSIILPLRLLDFVPEDRKNTYLGILTLVGLLLAVVVQPIAGTFSDHSGSHWGRRRPYILLGTIGILLLLPAIALPVGYAGLFVIYCLLQTSSNTTQGAYQGLIPDLVPPEKQGQASAAKALVELLGGVALLRLIAFFLDRHVRASTDIWLWLSLGILALVILACSLTTVLTIKERPSTGTHGLVLAKARNSFIFNINFRRDLAWFLMMRFAILMAFIIIQTFAFYYFVDVLHMSNPAAGAADLLTIIGICVLAATYPAGFLSDRLGRKPVIILAGLIGAFCMVAIFLFTSYNLLLVCGSLLGISFGAFTSANWAIATNLVVKGEEAKYLGLLNIPSAGAGVIARLIGPMIDFFNGRAPGVNLGYKFMFLVCFFCFAAGALSALKIRTQR